MSPKTNCRYQICFKFIEGINFSKNGYKINLPLICPVSTAACNAVCLVKLAEFKLAPANLKQLNFFLKPSRAK